MALLASQLYAAPYEPLFRIGVAYDVRLRRTEEVLLTIASSRQIKLWDCNTGVSIHAAGVRDAAHLDMSHAGDRALVSTTSGGCSLFSMPELDPLRSIRAIGEGPRPWFSADGDAFVQASWAGQLRVHSATSDETLLDEREADRMIVGLCASEDRRLFVFTSTVNDVVLVTLRRWPFDTNAGEEVARVHSPGASDAECALIDGERLLLRSGQRLVVLELTTGRTLAERHLETSGVTEAVAALPTGELLATMRGPGDARYVVGLSCDLEPLWRIKAPYACALDHGDSGSLLVVGGWEGGFVYRRGGNAGNGPPRKSATRTSPAGLADA